MQPTKLHPQTQHGDELTITWAGWFMCRLATDPDPTDEKRGVSGSTFAYGDEPDFDRVIRFHAPPELVRSHCPAVGVFVREATLGGERVEALLGARINLLGHPKFENRNFVLTMAGKEPIVPFEFEVLGEGFHLRRTLSMEPLDPAVLFSKLPRNTLQRYGARGFYTSTDKVLAATGIADPLQNRRDRRAALLRDLEHERDETRREVLRRRVRELTIAIDEPTNERLVLMRAIEEFTFPLHGEADVSCELPFAGKVQVHRPWAMDFWMGGWDPDALSGFVQGTVRIPVDRLAA